jgi:hypothetical protein
MTMQPFAEKQVQDDDDNDGLSAQEIFASRYGYAYDDIIVLPGYVMCPVLVVPLFTVIAGESLSVSMLST